MYLKFTTQEECNNCIISINHKMGYNGNITTTFANPMVDVDGNYLIPKPKQSIIVELSTMFNYVEVDNISFQVNKE